MTILDFFCLVKPVTLTIFNSFVDLCCLPIFCRELIPKSHNSSNSRHEFVWIFGGFFGGFWRFCFLTIQIYIWNNIEIWKDFFSKITALIPSTSHADLKLMILNLPYLLRTFSLLKSLLLYDQRPTHSLSGRLLYERTILGKLEVLD